MLYPIRKQVYKLELFEKWRIHDVFHVSLLEKDSIKKRRVDDENAVELDASNNSGEYEVEPIRDSTVYAKKLESGHLPSFYYLVSWKGYPEEEIWKPASAVQHLNKLISLFYKDYPKKPTATSSAINTTPPIARPTARPTEPLKWK